MQKTVFIESLINHQKLVDILLKHKNDNGVCEISEEKIAILMERSLAWVKKAINKINTEDLCVQVIGKNQYIVHYEDLTKRGVFNIIFTMILETFFDEEVWNLKNKEIMQKFGCSIKTVQMYRAYLSTGWTQRMKKEWLEDDCFPTTLQ